MRAPLAEAFRRDFRALRRAGSSGCINLGIRFIDLFSCSHEKIYSRSNLRLV